MAKSLDEQLKVVATELGKSYLAWKSNERKKDTARKKFFKLATEDLVQSELAEDVVEIEATDAEQARDLISKKYPAWSVETVREHPDREGWFEAIIQENPDLLPYALVEGGFKIKRVVSKGQTFIDDERLLAEDPDLWHTVTYVPEPERRLHSLDDLDSPTLAKLQPYIYEGEPKISLGPVTKVDGD